MCYVFKKNLYSSLKYLSWFGVKSFQKYQFLRLCSAKAAAFKRKDVSSTTLEPKYLADDVESHWYDWWEKQNYFKPSKSDAESFVILLPPPNITGTLHLGHALMATVQDVIIRWKRMKGESVLWIPGVDHAGIATQVAVEKYLNQTLGVSKHDLGKSEFIKKVWEWKEDKENRIVDQFRSLGASLDWTRLTFTMDSRHSQTVTDAFIQLFNAGLIYRKEDLINWSCAMKSSISDVEVDWIDVEGKTKINVPGYEKPVYFGLLYKFAYKVCDEDDEIVVATTRPETMLGDVAVAVHPEDPSYSKYRNKQLWHPFRKVKIPVVSDASVDQSFGTGAVKITPSHSLVDLDIALRHNLTSISVINEEGLINNVGDNEKLHGLKRFHARNVILDELKALNLFRGLEEHSMKLPICSRSKDVIELILKEQWFLNCKSFAQKAVEAVKRGDLKLEPESYASVWFEWLDLIRDWNLSRQLWWGHQIPMYECKTRERTVWVPASGLKEAEGKASELFGGSLTGVSVKQDPDVLDTWFSSGLLPMSVGGGSEDKPAISLMVTGHDILFFWVARMVMLSSHLTGKLPFQQVLLHSLVGDANGKKMSKSVGNVIYPEDVIRGRSASEMKAQIEETFKQGLMTKKNYQLALDAQKKSFPNGIPRCGADALRFTLCSRDFQSHFINFDVDLCLSNSHFCNKIWQATKYLIRVTDSQSLESLHLQNIDVGHADLDCFDRWILSRLAFEVDAVDTGIGSHKFYKATQAIKLFLVEEFCSVYLESSKFILKEASSSKITLITSVLFHCLETSLRLLSPFMPFVTEHLYHALPPLKKFNRAESIMVAEFPDPNEWVHFRDVELDAKFDNILKLLTVLRKTKVTYEMTQAKPDVFVKCSDDLADVLFGDCGYVFKELARMGNVSRVDNHEGMGFIREVINEDCIAYIKLDKDKDSLLRILGSTVNKEEKLRKSLDKLLKATSGTDWEENSPEEEVEKKRKEIKTLKTELNKIKEFKEVIENCLR